MKFISWLLLATAATALEPVKLPLDVGTLKTRDGKVFEAAKITGHDAVGVKILHAGGVARVEYARLPKNLAERFPRDREAAKEQLEKEAQDEAANDKAVVKKAPAAADTGEKAGTRAEKAPELKGDPVAQISTLEAYVRRLEDGIAKSRTTVAILEKEVKDLQRWTEATYTDANGRTHENRSKRTQAERKSAEITAENDKISEAERLVMTANAQLDELRTRVKP